MSEKKAFMLYLDYKQHLELLTDAERGMLMMALFDYAADKTEPTTLTGSAAMAFSFIRAQMDRDNQKYEEKCITNRANGAKGGRPRKEPTESDANPKEPKKTERFSEKPKKPDTDTETDTDTDTNTDTDNKTTPPTPKGEKPPSAQERRFDEFWALYPKKVGKAAAKKAWKRAKVDAELHEHIITALRAAITSVQWTRDNGRFIPNPSTWLNQGRWDDELEQATPGSRQSTQRSGKVDTFGVMAAMYQEEVDGIDQSRDDPDGSADYFGIS